MVARYDAFAERYAAFADEYDDAQPHSPLPPDIVGQRVLDLACGSGRFTRHVARAGARVVGIDLSPKLIEIARARDDGIDYRVGDAASVEWWDGQPFDGVTCHMALMDIDDLDGVRGTVGANHRMLSTYLNAVVRRGLGFEEFRETALPGPMYFLARCGRA